MIPICRDPKRFVAALNKDRYSLISALRFSVMNVNLVPKKSPEMNILNRQRFFSMSNKTIEGTNIHVNYDSITNKSKINMKLIDGRNDLWWTGKKPIYGECPGVWKDGKLYSLPQLVFDKKKATKESIQAYFDNTWAITEVLFASLQGEETFMRPPYHDLRHPMIFYYGHPAALYVNKLRVAGLIKDPINPYFESIFETGVDEMSWDDLSKNRMSWPSVAQVHSYRKQVYKTVSSVIQAIKPSQLENLDQSSPLWSLVMSFEHERIHIETSSFLINELPIELVKFPSGFPSYHPSTPTPEREVKSPIAGEHFPVNEMISVPAQSVSIGKPREFPTFGWDNEYGQKVFDIPAFKASKFKISNGEYLEFVKDGGYARNELWTEVGWKWRAYRNVKWPTMWVRKGPQGHHEYDLRLLFDVCPMAWSWPVCVNYHEAAAFAKWKSLKTGRKYRVLTELEHRAIRDSVPVVGDTASTAEYSGAYLHEDHATVAAGNKMQELGYNTNLAFSSMSPVNAMKANSKGFHDVFGNAWEWTEDYFCALPGFQVHPFYEDFSTPCFDGLHHIIQGGSFISTGNEASVHSRFHFRPHFYQHASFRVVEQLEDKFVTSDTDAPGPFVGNYPFRRSDAKVMEAARAASVSSHDINGLISKHFGSFQVGNLGSSMSRFKMIIESFAAEKNIAVNKAKALEVGCGPGGLTFELARSVDIIIGIDHDADCISFAKDLSAQKTLHYSLKAEGELSNQHQVKSPTDLKASQVEFRCADPMCIPAEMKDFDIVILHDVLDKMSAPNSVLGRLGGVRGLVKPGGVLAVISSYQWNENRTPKSLWLGGFKGASNEIIRSEETLKSRLAEDFVAAKSAAEVPVFWKSSESDLSGKIYTVSLFSRHK